MICLFTVLTPEIKTQKQQELKPAAPWAQSREQAAQALCTFYRHANAVGNKFHLRTPLKKKHKIINFVKS